MLFRSKAAVVSEPKPIAEEKSELIPVQTSAIRNTGMVIREDAEHGVAKRDVITITSAKPIENIVVPSGVVQLEIASQHASATMVIAEDPSDLQPQSTITPMMPLPAKGLSSDELVPVPQPEKAAASFIIISEDRSDAEDSLLPPSTSIQTPIEVAPASQQTNKIIAPDSDGDGFNDYEDPCPYIKGPASTKGCPDTDNDGIMDMMDFCPLESGPKSNGGCPVKELHGPGDQQIIRSFDHILFNSGSTTLTIDNTFDIVERAIEILYEIGRAHV